MANLQQIWNGEIITSDDRERHKFWANDFVELARLCYGVTCHEPKSCGNGMYLIAVETSLSNTSFNILYQDLRSGHLEGDARKRLQVSHVSIDPHKKCYYVGGYNAGDKKVFIAYLTKVKEINDTVNFSSRWIDWEPFYQAYITGIHLWNKKDISYLGCTDDNLQMFFAILASHTLGQSVPASTQSGVGVKPVQKIFFGSPGTGKSYRVKEQTSGQIVHRTTFHPDTDYTAFVGAYKPANIDVPVRNADGQEIPGVFEKKIVYQFTPQVFTHAYCEAWNEYLNNTVNPRKVCLLIEELNRGNCAQIFGDLFQLLDRRIDTGFSEYSISADEDLASYIRSQIVDVERYYNAVRDNSDLNSKGEKCIAAWNASGENRILLSLPPNLSIICTMNTSDQSLFPMDSAFKRRWDWEYIPIDYALEESQFIIVVDESHKYSWPDFLKKMNKIIYEQTKSEDKQMGNFFVRGNENKEVSRDQFISKVMYFLWSEICKDNPKARKTIFVTGIGTPQDGELPICNDFTFSDLFPTNYDEDKIPVEEILKGFMVHHGVENIADTACMIDYSDTEGETIKDKWEHTIYSDDLISYINNASDPKVAEFKKLFPQDYKSHLNGFAVGVDYGGWITLSRNKKANLVCYGNQDADKMRSIMDEYGEQVKSELGVPPTTEGGRYDSRWMITPKQGQVKLAKEYTPGNPNRDEEFQWYVEHALKLYHYFKKHFRKNDNLI